ncbi:ALK tyrosine kinase receptor-like [Homarus americanus]|uniref:ALK tyrosine kinase receptor-like n=1 Tax=Homarus americanus TaxID=6706 RepID=UPI001C482FE1|nr:ALK tyrosine kinase receptor-like [Homarus americanus]
MGVSALASCGECGCSYQCVRLDEYLHKYECVCDDNWRVDEDGHTCVLDNSVAYPQTIYLFVIIIGILLVIFISATSICCYNRYQKKKFDQIRREIFSGGPEMQLNRLRNEGGMVTEYNPNYEFGGGTCYKKDLKEIPRENLTLVKALGQGAFGEVYQGYLKNYAGDSVEMPVAVKTLPEMSSNQSEMDFLMEALIMSKFAHPNIVHFIGVCFDKLPRFIVLELLSGGDLKSFLREARPKPVSVGEVQLFVYDTAAATALPLNADADAATAAAADAALTAAAAAHWLLPQIAPGTLLHFRLPASALTLRHWHPHFNANPLPLPLPLPLTLQAAAILHFDALR